MSSRQRVEAWGWAAYAIAAAYAALLVYLGLRPGGRWPVILYMEGRALLSLAALLALFVGGLWSLLHRPVAQRRRLGPLIAGALVVGAGSYAFPYPSSREGHPSSICFRLPVDGEWTVLWGGDDKRVNRLAGFYPDQRWGLHLVKLDEGRAHAGQGLAPSEHHAFDQPVLAPADGRVAAVHDGEPDREYGEQRGGVEPFGNYVVLEVASGEYLFATHLRQGSLRVRPGERVQRGGELGRVGSSGLSPVTPQPHVAVHLQDTPVPRRGEAVPWRFCAYEADGRRVEAGLPTGGVARDGKLLGQRVRALE